MVHITLSRRLGELRLTQADVARMTGIRAATINLYYHDLAEKIPKEHLDLLCDALHCGVGDLIEYEPNEPSRITRDRSGRPIGGR